MPFNKVRRILRKPKDGCAIHFLSANWDPSLEQKSFSFWIGALWEAPRIYFPVALKSRVHSTAQTSFGNPTLQEPLKNINVGLQLMSIFFETVLRRARY